MIEYKKNVYVFDHPLIQHKLTLIRDKTQVARSSESLLKR